MQKWVAQSQKIAGAGQFHLSRFSSSALHDYLFELFFDYANIIFLGEDEKRNT